MGIEQPPLTELFGKPETWENPYPAYREFRVALLSDKPPKACANCGLRWSL